jgi:hypothetical protein
MIKTLTAFTTELDDEQLAIEQINTQIGSAGALMKNTIGIVSCHYEFVLSGVYKAICEALPFGVVGSIASAQSTQEESGMLLMTLTVLTSDDVEFDKVMTSPLLEEPGKVVADSYQSACRDEKPALILMFAPFMLQNCCDDYVNALTEISGGVPCFGTQAIDDTPDFSYSFVLADGEQYRDQMVMLLIYGDIHPKFFVANISERKIFDKSAVVTKSMGPVLMEVNDRPVIEYLEDLGLVKASETQYAMTSLPFLLDYNDGTPKVSKVLAAITPEKFVVCAGAMPQGSTLFMTRNDKDDIVFTTEEISDIIAKETEGASVMLIYSCLVRSMTLGSDQFKEMDIVSEKIGKKIPYMFAISGGEICPTQVSEGNAINRFHNNTFVACVF